jgi:ferric-dicitrate binding protein FerR (iron transport regulator)
MRARAITGAHMPATAAPFLQSPDVDAFRRGDERAFERIFRASYGRVIGVAREVSETPGSPSRVAEQTYLRAWHARDGFDRPEALEQFLSETAHEVAVREKARRGALHRFEAHEKVTLAPSHAPEPTMDDVWTHIASGMHAAPLDEAALKHRDELIRHEAAVHMAQATQRKISKGTIAGVAVLGLGLAAALGFMTRGGNVYALNKALAADDVRELRAQTGQRANVTLGDETAVRIGSDSRIRVPAEFGNALRGVMLEGTASFNVTRASGTGVDPFEVRASGLRLVAKGSVFDVRTDFGPTLMLRVREGTVAVSGARTTSDVAAGRTVRVDSLGEVSDASSGDAGPAFSWVDGQFVTQAGATVGSVLPELKRWYRLTLEVTDSAVLANPVAFSASLESSKDAIAALETSGKVKFGYAKDGETMQLSPAPTVAPPKAKARRR